MTTAQPRPSRRSGPPVPRAPTTLAEAGLPPAWVDGLIAKLLLQSPSLTGGQVARELALPRDAVNERLDRLKQRMFAVRHDTTLTGDFRYELSDSGRRLAEEASARSRYVGPAPVPLSGLRAAVAAQGVSHSPPTPADLARALGDLVLPRQLVAQLGPAVGSGRALFLYGPPGNGKTSIAERIARAYGTGCWMPHAVLADDVVIQLLDPHVHQRLPDPKVEHDPRYAWCRRPCIVAGGELTLAQLELRHDPVTGLCEAPLQLKAACGLLVIDDFGRQRVSPEDLLNRWIVPLERRVDYLTLPNGRKITVPFDPFVIFSTNLNPSALVDEAFLRRIPFKVHLGDPHESLFRDLFEATAHKLELSVEEGVFDHLIDAWYAPTARPFRYCHPRDLLSAVRDQAAFLGEEPHLDEAALDMACRSYFIAKIAS